MGHVGQARYHEFLDSARNRVFGSMAGDDGVYPFALVRVELDHRAELLVADPEIVIDTALEELGTRKVVLAHRMTGRTGTVVAEARSFMVAFDASRRTSRTMQSSEHDRIRAVFGR